MQEDSNRDKQQLARRSIETLKVIASTRSKYQECSRALAYSTKSSMIEGHAAKARTTKMSKPCSSTMKGNQTFDIIICEFGVNRANEIHQLHSDMNDQKFFEQ